MGKRAPLRRLVRAALFLESNVGVIQGLYWGYIGVIQGLYKGYNGIMENKMEPTL